MRIKCFIIDDEPIARKVVHEFISKISFLEFIGEAGDPIEASSRMNNGEIDLIFLDVQMPRLDGLQFLKLQASPSFLTILTTAYPTYAVEGFDLNILDYLVKPIAFERFERACVKAKQYVEMKAGANTESFFFVKVQGRIEKIEYDELFYIESIGNYLKLHLQRGTVVTYLTLKGMLDQLPADSFVHVHKSFVVNKAKITSLEGNEIKLGEFSVPIGQKMREEVLQLILGGKYFKR